MSAQNLNQEKLQVEQVPKLGISDCRKMAFNHLNASKDATFYLEILSFEIICMLYKMIYKSTLTLHSSRNIFKTFKQLFDTTWYASGSSVTAAELSFKPENSDIQIVPDLGCWMVQGFVSIKGNSQPSYQPLYTHPMDKSELIKATNLLKDDKKIKKWNNVNLTIWSHETLLTPETIFYYQSLNDFPKRALILPATGGVSLKLDCSTEKQKAEIYSSYYTCVPKQYDVGNLKCTSYNGKFTEASYPKLKRTVRSLSHTINSYFNFTHYNKIIKENSPNAIAIALKNTRKLLPNIMSCGASVAGCDYCMYFLTTYNLTVSPAACVGGCSLGTFASCSSLIGTSFVNTYLT